MKDYDYSQPGAYFVTMCVIDRRCMLGELIDKQVVLSPAGKIVEDVWQELPVRYRQVELDAFCVMPNHVHGIIVITGEQNAPNGLPEIVGALKRFCARRINWDRPILGESFWQRNYYEHIIRSESEWKKIRDYILTNPDRWDEDQLNPNFSPIRSLGG